MSASDQQYDPPRRLRCVTLIRLRVLLGVWLLRPLLVELKDYAAKQHDVCSLDGRLERYWMGRMTAVDILLRLRHWEGLRDVR